MEDIAQLGFSIDSTPAVQAATALDRMSTSAAAAAAGAATLSDRHKQYVQALEQTVQRQNSLIESMQRSGAAAQELQQRIPELASGLTAFERAIQSAADAVDNRITASLRRTAQEIKTLESSFKGVDLAGWTESSRAGFAALHQEAERFYRITGQAPQQMLRFQYVTERIGLDARDTAKAIERLSAAMQGISREGLQVRETLARYGVVPQADTAQTAVAFSDAVLRARPSTQRTQDAMAVFGTNDPEIINRIAGFSAVRRAEDQVDRGNRLRRETDELESIRVRSMAEQIRSSSLERSNEANSLRRPSVTDDIFSRTNDGRAGNALADRLVSMALFGPLASGIGVSGMGARAMRQADRLSGADATTGGNLQLILRQMESDRAASSDAYRDSGGYFGRVGRIASGSFGRLAGEEAGATVRAGVDSVRNLFGFYTPPQQFTREEADAEFERRLQAWEARRAQQGSSSAVRERATQALRFGPIGFPMSVGSNFISGLFGLGPERAPDRRDLLLRPEAPPISEAERGELFDILARVGIGGPSATMGATRIGRIVGDIAQSGPNNFTATQPATDNRLREVASAVGRPVDDVRRLLLEASNRISFAAEDPTGFALGETRFRNSVYSAAIEDRPLELRARAFAAQRFGFGQAPISDAERLNLRAGLISDNDAVNSGNIERVQQQMQVERAYRDALVQGGAAAEEARIRQEALNEARRRGMTETQSATLVETQLREMRSRRVTERAARDAPIEERNRQIDFQIGEIAAAERTPLGLVRSQLRSDLDNEVERRYRATGEMASRTTLAAQALPAERLALETAVARAETTNAENDRLVAATTAGGLQALQQTQAQMRANEQTAKAMSLAMESGSQAAIDKVRQLNAALVETDLTAQRAGEGMRIAMAGAMAGFRTDANNVVATLGPRERAIADSLLSSPAAEPIARLPEGPQRNNAIRQLIAGREVSITNPNVPGEVETLVSGTVAAALRRSANSGIDRSLVDAGEQLGAQNAALQNALRIMREGGTSFEARLAMTQANAGIMGGAANAAMRRQMIGQSELSAFDALEGQRDALRQATALTGVATGTGLEQQITQINASLNGLLSRASPTAAETLRDTSRTQIQAITQQAITARRASNYQSRIGIEDAEVELSLGAGATPREINRAVGMSRLNRGYRDSIRDADLAAANATDDAGRERSTALRVAADESFALGIRNLDISEQLQQMREYREAASDAASVVSTGFRAAALEGRKLGDVMKYVTTSIGAIGMRVLFEKPLERAMTSVFAGMGGGGGSGGADTSSSGAVTAGGIAGLGGIFSLFSGNTNTLARRTTASAPVVAQITNPAGTITPVQPPAAMPVPAPSASPGGTSVITAGAPLPSGNVPKNIEVPSGGGFGSITSFFGGGNGGAFSATKSFGDLFGAGGAGGMKEGFVAGADATVGAVPDVAGGAGAAAGGGFMGWAGGVAGGYAIGSTIGGMLAGDSRARQQNAQIGAAGGAIIGSVFGPAGALIGGAIGGAGGGLIGPGRAFSGGDALLQIDDSGMIKVDKYKGKNFEQKDALLQDAKRQADELNAVLKRYSLRFREVSGEDGIAGAIGGGESKNPKDIVGALAAFGNNKLDLVSTKSAFVQQALNSNKDNTDLNEALKSVAWVTDTYEALIDLDRPASSIRDRFKEIAETFGPAIEEAEKLTLSTDRLRAAQARQNAETVEAQRVAYVNTTQSVTSRWFRAVGLDKEADLNDFDTRTQSELVSFRKALEDLSASTEDVTSQMDRLKTTQALERAKIEKAYADQDASTKRNLATNARGILENLAFGSSSALSPEARSMAAKKTLMTALGALDDGGTQDELNELARVASPTLGVIREAEGTTEAYGGLVNKVAQAVKNAFPGSDVAGLAAVVQSQTSVGDQITAAVLQSGAGTQRAIAALQEEMRLMSTRFAALAASLPQSA